jgi:hypothetical protein
MEAISIEKNFVGDGRKNLIPIYSIDAGISIV